MAAGFVGADRALFQQSIANIKNFPKIVVDLFREMDRMDIPPTNRPGEKIISL